jgi:hypothetical protein
MKEKYQIQVWIVDLKQKYDKYKFKLIMCSYTPLM